MHPTDIETRQPLLHLFQLVSPSLPTGAFAYSQGLEWAVDHGWVTNREEVEAWFCSTLYTAFGELEIPVLKRLYHCCADNDLDGFARWCRYLAASRETRELRREEEQRGRAMARLMAALDDGISRTWVEQIALCQAGGFAVAAVRSGIGVSEIALGYTWSWLENMVMAAIKLVPLGQTTGQAVLTALAPRVGQAVERGMACEDEEMGGSCPACAIASSRHEQQYTRLFRS